MGEKNISEQISKFARFQVEDIEEVRLKSTTIQGTLHFKKTSIRIHPDQ